MKIWFTKTSYYSSLDGCEREFNNLDEAVKCLIEECSNDGKYGRNPELIIYKDIYSKENKCDYIIEFYDDWRE